MLMSSSMSISPMEDRELRFLRQSSARKGKKDAKHGLENSGYITQRVFDYKIHVHLNTTHLAILLQFHFCLNWGGNL